MTETGKTTKGTTFDISSCMEMMEKMMGQHMERCDCAEMTSQIAEQSEIPPDWHEMMSMFISFCGSEAGEKSVS